MPTPTYTLISETVLGSAQASVTFNSFPSTYKDLVLEIIAQVSSGSEANYIRFNGDTGTNYSFTSVRGDGSSASSGRVSNANQVVLNNVDSVSTSGNWSITNAHIMSYSNTSINKTVLSRAGNASSGVSSIVNLWRNTAAITSILVFCSGTNTYASGSTFRLWGVIG